ncbi:MAG: hypothetical protein EPO26_05745 [Chloroflexota bacterium]|nr:MAG: hypothetical protein EPO26_05745 [Chloroflexota bacterium]
MAVTDGYATALVEDAAFAVERYEPRRNQVGLYVEGHGLEPRPGQVPGWARDLLKRALRIDVEQGWQSIEVHDREGTPRFTHDFGRDDASVWSDDAATWFHLVDGTAGSSYSGFIGSPEFDWPIGEVEAVARRGRTLGLVVDGDGRDGGLFLMVRPEHRDVIWWRLSDGAWTGPIAGGPFNRPWLSPIKEFVRVVLSPILAAAIVTGAMLVIGAAIRRREQRARSDIGRFAAWFAAVVIGGLTLAVTAFVADGLLDRIPHVQDSVAYLFQAKLFAMGRLWAPAPPLPDFFWHEFIVIDGDRWFAKYPPGFPLILAAGVLLGAPWLVNPVLAALTILVIYAIGAHLWSRTVGLLAAGLIAVSPFAIGLGGSHMAHTAGLLLFGGFVLAYIRASRGGTGAAILAGLALGLDFLVRPWTAIVLAVPFGIDAIVAAARDRHARGTLVRIAAGATPALAIWLAYSAILTGHPFGNTMEMWWSFDRLGFGADKGMGGHSPFNGLLNTLRNSNEFARHAFGWPSIATLAFAWTPFVARRAGRWEWLLGASAAGLGIGYWLWWADGVMYGPRFYFEALAPIALLSARGIAVLGGLGGPIGRILISVTVSLLIAANLGIYLPRWLGQLQGYNYINGDPIAAVAAAGISHAIVLVDPGQPNQWWNYGMVFSANDPLLAGPILFARDLGPLNRDLLERYPDRSVYRLRGMTLIPMRGGE